MRAENHHFIGLGAATNFSNRVVYLGWLVANRVRNFDFDRDWAVFEQPPNHSIPFTSDERRRECPDVKFFSANSSHIQQTVRFAGITENRGNSFLFEKIIARASCFYQRRKR